MNRLAILLSPDMNGSDTAGGYRIDTVSSVLQVSLDSWERPLVLVSLTFFSTETMMMVTLHATDHRVLGWLIRHRGGLWIKMIKAYCLKMLNLRYLLVVMEKGKISWKISCTCT